MSDHGNKRICRAHPMHLVLLADDSGSMEGEAAEQVTLGIRTWLSELQASAGGGTKSYFYFSLVLFGTHAKTIVSSMNLNDIDPEEIEVLGKSGRTYMARALAAARETLANDGASADYCPPFVFLYTDGKADDPDATISEAALLKGLSLPCGSPSLVTLGFGSTDDIFLAQLATSPEFYKRTRDAQELADLLPSIGTPTARGGSSTVDAFRRRIREAAANEAQDLEI